MKSEKSSLRKTVKGVTESLRKRTSAVAGKFTGASKPKASAAAPPPAAAPGSRAKTRSPEPPVAPAPKAKIVTPEPPAVPEEKPKRKTPPRKPALSVPPILLEGDQPSAPPVGGPGQRYALGPTPPSPQRPAAEPAAELPEAYGTKRLLLTARDPHWLYARWDLTRHQQREYNSLSVDRHLVVRVYLDAVKGQPVSQTHVHPESTHWFIHVADAGAKYIAALGYYRADGNWIAISASDATLTPPDTMSDDMTAEFATIPIEVPFAELMALAQEAVRQNIPLAEIIQQLRAHGHPGFAAGTAPGRWTAGQARALASIITMDSVRRVWMGSLEITELIRRQLQQELSSMAAAQFSLPTSPAGAVTSVSSPFGGVSQQKGFWFNVNAELIIYGATEPDAQVTIGGRVIRLRSDGTFSYRFALPDGKYELPAVAISADRTDGRAAELAFSRNTEYRGDVGTHPQDPRLQPPLAANVA
jgi:hypothetical protein